MERCTRRGFTLIELSIVLVIVGLVIGGVIVGKDMIYNAQIRQALAQVEGYKTAVNAFKIKFHCLPGDCAIAEKLGLGTSGGDGSNGNGDSQITSRTISSWGEGSVSSNEASNFWYHLSRAQMISGQYPGSTTTTNDAGRDSPKPRIPLHNNDGDGTGGWRAHYSNMTSTSNNLLVIRNTRCGADQPAMVAPLDAYMLDSKSDDGLPLSGKAKAWTYDGCASAGSYWEPDLGAPGSANAITTSGSQTLYNIINSDVSTHSSLMILTFEAGF